MTHRSWATQRIANRLPPWSDARVLPFSVVQQIVNPMATAIEDLYHYVSDGNSNRFLSSANLDLMDVAYVVRLPNDFQFGMYQNDIQTQKYVAPTVKTTIDGKQITLNLTETVEDFWYNSLPTRAIHGSTERRVPVKTVLDTTVLDDLEDAVINEIALPTRLVITISDCSTFVDTSRRTEVSFLMLTGMTERGIEEKEAMMIPYNGVFLTKKIWKSLSKVESYGLQPRSTGSVTIDCFAFNKGREIDKYQIYVTPFQEKLLYHKLGSHDFTEGTYSTHQQMTVTANSLGDLYNGNDTLEAVREIELMYNGENLLLYDIAVQPFTGRIFAVSDDALYIFDPYTSLCDCTRMGRKTPGASMIIDVDKYDFIRGESVTLRPYWRKPSKRIYKNRWSVRKPDGTVAYINIDGVESSDAVGAWITNKTYMALAFGPFDSDDGEIDKQSFNYTLTQRGTYQFILETHYTDDSVEKDIVPLQVHYKEALAKIDLPPSLQYGDGIAFDADQKLWILRRVGEGQPYDLPYAYGQKYNISGCAYEVKLATDNMLVDFTNKVIYLHENYGSVSVTESEDWVVTR